MKNTASFDGVFCCFFDEILCDFSCDFLVDFAVKARWIFGLFQHLLFVENDCDCSADDH